MAYISENGIVREMTAEEESNLSVININDRINELKLKLAETDYIACKIAEGSATQWDYADIIAQRQLWRNEINKLQEENK